MVADVVTIPHFDLPFRFGVSGESAAVVQQGSQQDVRNCVEAIIRTPVGSRLHVPNFGIDDPTFLTSPLQTTNIEQQVIANEPRAVVALDSIVDEINTMADDITAEVSGSV